MTEIFDYTGENFKALFCFEGWKIGFLRYGDRFASLTEKERHLQTDEAFILLDGSATLYADGKHIIMEKCKVYNIKKATWHNITVSHDATVMVVENSNTSKENTERLPIDSSSLI